MLLQAVVMEPGPGRCDKESDSNDETEPRGRMCVRNRHGREKSSQIMLKFNPEHLEEPSCNSQGGQS